MKSSGGPKCLCGKALTELRSPALREAWKAHPWNVWLNEWMNAWMNESMNKTQWKELKWDEMNSRNELKWNDKSRVFVVFDRSIRRRFTWMLAARPGGAFACSATEKSGVRQCGTYAQKDKVWPQCNTMWSRLNPPMPGPNPPQMGKWEGALSVQQDKILIVAKPLPSRWMEGQCLEIVRARLKYVWLCLTKRAELLRQVESFLLTIFRDIRLFWYSNQSTLKDHGSARLFAEADELACSAAQNGACPLLCGHSHPYDICCRCQIGQELNIYIYIFLDIFIFI